MMNIFLPEHTEILQSFNKHNVQYMLIGGYAVIYHGYNRTTGDLDIWIKPDNENKLNIIKAFDGLGFDSKYLQKLGEFDFTNAIMFFIGAEPQKIEFMTKVSRADFETAYSRKILCEVEDGLVIPYIHLDDLVLTKMNTGRTKDKADVEELQKIKKLKA